MVVKVRYVSTSPNKRDHVEFNIADATFGEMATDLIDQWDIYRFKNDMLDAAIVDVREVTAA